MKRRHALAAGLLAALLLAPTATAAQSSGLPVPRFVTLRSAEVNVRTGPGTRYPVDWVFVRADLPVEVIEEFEEWRLIRDSEGVEGWVHQSLLSGRRGVVVQGGDAEPVPLRNEPDTGGTVTAEAEPGVVGRLLRCPSGAWCYVELGGYRGWIERGRLWGVYAEEVVE